MLASGQNQINQIYARVDVGVAALVEAVRDLFRENL